MFRQSIPTGQPRTLRSIAQTKGAAPANLMDDNGYDTNGGVPASDPTAYQEYEGLAGAHFNSSPQQVPTSVFKNVKRGG